MPGGAWGGLSHKRGQIKITKHLISEANKLQLTWNKSQVVRWLLSETHIDNRGGLRKGGTCVTGADSSAPK